MKSQWEGGGGGIGDSLFDTGVFTWAGNKF